MSKSELNCLNKKDFYSRRKARRYRRIASKIFRTKYQIYICPVCGKYHLTSK